MDSELKKIILMLQTQNDVLSRARYEYLTKEAERKHFEARLVMAEAGIEKQSHALSLSKAQASDTWLKFQQDLAKLQSVFEFQKLKYEILDKEFLAVYGTMKIEAQTISRGQ